MWMDSTPIQHFVVFIMLSTSAVFPICIALRTLQCKKNYTQTHSLTLTQCLLRTSRLIEGKLQSGLAFCQFSSVYISLVIWYKE